MEEKKWSKEKEELFNRWTKYHTKENRDIVGFQQSMEDVLDFILEELDKAREEGRREVYEAIVFDKNIPHGVTTFVAANLWKNMRDKAKEELSKLTTK